MVIASNIEPQGHSQHGRALVSTAACPVERAEPAQVAFEIGRGYALEVMQPTLQPAVIRVGVLDVPRSAHAFACTQVHCFVVHTKFLGGGRHRRRAVGAKDGVGVDARFESLAEAVFGDRLQQKVGRLPGAVAGDQDGYQVLAAVFARRPSPALARRAAGELPLAGAQEIGLVGLDHASKRWRLDWLGQLQEAMPPAKRRRGRHTQLGRSNANDQAAGQHTLLLQPLGLHTQASQRGLAQRIESALATSALIALQAAGTAIANDPRAAAMRANRRSGEPRLNELTNLGLVIPSAKRIEQLGLLGRRQPRHRRQPPLHLCRIHRKLQKPATRGYRAKSDAEVAHSVSYHYLMIKEPFRALKIASEDLDPGECELGVLVPRAFLGNRLDRFATELEELNQIFGVFAEVASGSRPGFEIKTISSTDLSVYLEVGAIVGACIATSVERIVALYKQLLEIRKTQAELTKLGVDKKNLKGLEDHANGVMETGIERLVKEIMSEYMPKGEAGRKNELSIELKFAMKKIANRIDRGFNIEVRMEEPNVEAEDPESATVDERLLLAAHARVSQASANLQFLKLEGEPILQLAESKGSKSRGEA